MKGFHTSTWSLGFRVFFRKGSGLVGDVASVLWGVVEQACLTRHLGGRTQEYACRVYSVSRMLPFRVSLQVLHYELTP